ncbi:MAG: hypothetical protein IKN67_01115 [Alphaproteobacteria bacterium]|nr:hypothetical protein [Alphaproteobacteria bacterium]
MIAKDRIYTTFKYLGCFLVCNILLWAVIWLITELDQDKLELVDCFAFEYGYITKTFDYQSYLQGACTYPQICTCAVNAEWILFFYIWSLPIFVFYEFFRRKIIPQQYQYLCVLGEIAFGAVICFLCQDNAPFLWFPLGNTYKIIAPMAIIMLALHSLPPKVLKVLSIIIGTIYGLYFGFCIAMIIPNFFR